MELKGEYKYVVAAILPPVYRELPCEKEAIFKQAHGSTYRFIIN